MQRLLDLIAQIERPRAHRKALLDAFVADTIFPLVTDDHAVFFFWDGTATEAVFLQHWVFGLPSRIELRRIPHTDAFYLPLDLPKTARVEYKFEIVKAGKGRWSADPRNPGAPTIPLAATRFAQLPPTKSRSGRAPTPARGAARS